ncbi:MAG: periplasmic heavy metal sensor [Candidatus Manganitrophus sp.]|nr:periplasmic heavy metal sensor [Candidatus Manganitrophus sp.]WDT73021.1 MAG: periplasmic heavy metal sensor [Candidatus Manganitrophus sp.]WDT79452.1 MAG: periplasmic heavy metal sensor [Candidatus Manganitrophus sp.]
MNKRNLFRKIGIGMLMVSLTAATVMAQGSPGQSPHRGGEGGRMERPQGHPPSSGMRGGSFFSAEGLKEGLNLTEEQAKKLHDLFIDYRKGVIQKRASLQVAEIELEELIADPKLDLSKIEKKAKEKEALETDMMMFRVRSMAKAKEFLSDVQYDKFRSMIERRMSMGGGGMHSGMHSMMGGMSHGKMGKGKGMMGSPHGSMGMGSPHGSMGMSDDSYEDDDE